MSYVSNTEQAKYKPLLSEREAPLPNVSFNRLMRDCY